MERVDAPAGATVLAVAGELDLAVSGRFRSHTEQAVEDGTRLLVVDMTEVTFMESTMLRELLRAREQLEQAGARLVLAGAGPAISRLLDLTGTSGLFAFTKTRSEALATFG